jgi:hypothetical protein
MSKPKSKRRAGTSLVTARSMIDALAYLIRTAEDAGLPRIAAVLSLAQGDLFATVNRLSGAMEDDTEQKREQAAPKPH